MRISVVLPIAALTVLAALLGYLYVDRNTQLKAVQREAVHAAAKTADLRRSEAQYRRLYGQFAALERYRLYDRVDESVRIYLSMLRDFTPIDSVTEKMVCPKPVKPLPDGFTYFGARNIVLKRTGTSPLLYSMSYYGEAASIRDRDQFDSLIDLGDAGRGRIVHLTAGQAANLMGNAPKPLTRNGTFFTPFSFNAADVNRDGTDDFFFGGRLQLSSGEGYRPIGDAALDGREVVFAGGGFLSAKADTLERWSFDGSKLVKSGSMKLLAPIANNRPFTILPLDGALTGSADAIIVTASSLDFYSLRDGKTERVLSLPTTAPHSLITGARGDFDGDGIDDLWLAESRWKNRQGQVVGRASLLSSRRFRAGATSVEDITAFALYGSAAYTDYDGIGASLSPVAGDFDGDGKPDLSIPGHVHMSGAGALYILLGKDIANATDLTVSDKPILRIVGKPISNLAPPFEHYDMPGPGGRSSIVVAADNDLCSGIAGGAIYFLNLSKLIDRPH